MTTISGIRAAFGTSVRALDKYNTAVTVIRTKHGTNVCVIDNYNTEHKKSSLIKFSPCVTFSMGK